MYTDRTGLQNRILEWLAVEDLGLRAIHAKCADEIERDALRKLLQRMETNGLVHNKATYHKLAVWSPGMGRIHREVNERDYAVLHECKGVDHYVVKFGDLHKTPRRETKAGLYGGHSSIYCKAGCDV